METKVPIQSVKKFYPAFPPTADVLHENDNWSQLANCL